MDFVAIDQFEGLVMEDKQYIWHNSMWQCAHLQRRCVLRLSIFLFVCSFACFLMCSPSSQTLYFATELTSIPEIIANIP